MSERVLCAVPVHERKGFRSPDQYAFVLTDRRAILVPFSKEALKSASEDAKERARSEGKGFFGRWGAQVQAVTGYAQPFLTMEPDRILGSPGAVAIDHVTVAAAKLSETSDEDSSSTTWAIHLTLLEGKRKFELRVQPGDLASAMRQAYGERFRG